MSTATTAALIVGAAAALVLGYGLGMLGRYVEAERQRAAEVEANYAAGQAAADEAEFIVAGAAVIAAAERLLYEGPTP